MRVDRLCHCVFLFNIKVTFTAKFLKKRSSGVNRIVVVTFVGKIGPISIFDCDWTAVITAVALKWSRYNSIYIVSHINFGDMSRLTLMWNSHSTCMNMIHVLISVSCVFLCDTFSLNSLDLLHVDTSSR